MAGPDLPKYLKDRNDQSEKIDPTWDPIQATASVCQSVSVYKVANADANDTESPRRTTLLCRSVDYKAMIISVCYNTMAVSVYWGVNDTKQTIHATS